MAAEPNRRDDNSVREYRIEMKAQGRNLNDDNNYERGEFASSSYVLSAVFQVNRI